MNDTKKAIISIICFVAVWLVCVIKGCVSVHEQAACYKAHIEEVYGDIQFKGEVLRLRKIRRWGRTYGLMCIKLDYTNIDKFYWFCDKTGGLFSSEDKNSCLKIKNGIATFPTGSIGSDDWSERETAIFNAKYIEVNIDSSRQIVYIDSVGNRYSIPLNFPSNNLIESDMRVCN